MIEEYSIQELSFNYGAKMVLENISFQIEPEKITVIIGPNGVGKTTFLKLLGKILSDYDGTILFSNKNLNAIKMKDYAREVGIMFADINFVYNYKVMEFILMARYPYTNPLVGYRKNDIEKAEEAIKQAEIDSLKDKNILELSSGELQLVLIAHLLAQDTRVLLLDEPFTHLDLKHQYLVIDFLKKINKIHKKTIVLVTHNVTTISRFADNVILLKNGRLFKKGKVKQTLTKKNIKDLYDIKKL